MNHLKLSILLLSVMAVGGCANTDKGATLETNYDTYYGYQIIKIDSCEYIKSSYGASVPLVHKGNCNNKIHKQ